MSNSNFKVDSGTGFTIYTVDSDDYKIGVYNNNKQIKTKDLLSRFDDNFGYECTLTNSNSTVLSDIKENPPYNDEEVMILGLEDDYIFSCYKAGNIIYFIGNDGSYHLILSEVISEPMSKVIDVITKDDTEGIVGIFSTGFDDGKIISTSRTKGNFDLNKIEKTLLAQLPTDMVEINMLLELCDDYNILKLLYGVEEGYNLMKSGYRAVKKSDSVYNIILNNVIEKTVDLNEFEVRLSLVKECNHI